MPTTIFGALDLNDRDRVFNATVGQQVIWDTVQEYVNRVNTDLAEAMSLFIGETTEDFKRRYKLPAGGYLQRRNTQGRYGAVKGYGQWDVAFPLNDVGAQVAGNDVDLAYMTALELNNHVLTVMNQNVNTVRYEILRALLDNLQESWLDPDHGTLLIEPLANGDAVVYPPVMGADDGATDNHYLESGYAVAAISDANNPLPVMRAELEEHFGESPTGSNVAVFVNTDAGPYLEALTDFLPVLDRFTQPGTGVTTLSPAVPPHPGTLLGRSNGAWVIEWRYVPTGYAIGIHLDAPPPMIQRVDPADTGLPRGINLIQTDREFPFQGSFWRHRFGLAVANRLNGVVMEFANGGTYTIPPAYNTP